MADKHNFFWIKTP